MRHKLIVIALIAAVIFSQASSAWAGAAKPDFEKRHDKMVKALNLTPEQEKQLNEYKEQAKTDFKAATTQLRAKKDQLRDQLNAAQVDEAAVRQTADEIKALQNKMVDHRIDSLLRMKKVLTPEQFAKFQELMKERKHRFMKDR